MAVETAESSELKQKAEAENTLEMTLFIFEASKPAPSDTSSKKTIPSNPSQIGLPKMMTKFSNI